jgi:hypothetical protein
MDKKFEDWQPIETLEEGELVIFCCLPTGEIASGSLYKRAYRWQFGYRGNPTHWMPLPPPPQQ